MSRTTFLLCALLATTGCGQDNRPAPGGVDCSVGNAYEFRNISDFASGQSGWFSFADNTPRAVPDPLAGSDLAVTLVDPPGRCGDTGMLQFKASGHNFYGSGIGDWAHNAESSRADGTGFDGISFWARSPGNTDKTFLLDVEDGRTLVFPPPAPAVGQLPPATEADQDLDGDGLIGPGDIARGTHCRLPPPQALGRPACYYGGALPPASPTRVPAADECGNSFHTYITTTEDWQLFLLPWQELVQWPCPNRLEGGINPADIAQLELKLLQGTNYEIWLDNIAFYRLRANASP